MAAWPPTRLQLVTEIRRILQDTSATAAEQDVSDAILNDLIDQAARTVQIRLGRAQGTKETSIVLTQGQFVYSTPTTSLPGITRVTHARLRPNTTTNLSASPSGFTDRPATIDRILVPLTQEQGRLEMGGGESATSATLGSPRWWWPEGRSQVGPTAQAIVGVGVWPAPDATTTADFQLILRFDNFAVSFATDTSTLNAPPGTDVPLEYLVASWVKSWIGDLREAVKFEQIFERTMADVIATFAGEFDIAPERPLDAYQIL